jgi:hypothetical protein
MGDPTTAPGDAGALAQEWAWSRRQPAHASAITDEDERRLLAWVAQWCPADALDDSAPAELADLLGVTHEQAALLIEESNR